MNVVLIGMKGSGKSTLGEALARRWGCPFGDTDAMIEELYAREAETPRTVREIFTEEGEERFHHYEARVVHDLFQKLTSSEERMVVAVGGRTVLNPTAAELLRGIGLVVHLRVPPEELLRRLRGKGRPAYLAGDDPDREFVTLCHERRPYYEQHAHISVDVGGLSVSEALDKLEHHIRSVQSTGRE